MVIFAPQMAKNNLFKSLLSAILLVMFAHLALAQRGGNTAWRKFRHEASVGYGVNNLFSQLGERDSPVAITVFQRSTFNASYRYYFMKNFAARASFSHGYARKNDKEIPENGVRNNVRIDYASTLSEMAAMLEYHLMDETTKGRKGKVRRARGGMSKGLNLGVSVFAGAGVSYFRPYGEYFGERVIFRPVTDPLTIPNDAAYRQTRLHFPIGAQVRILASENWRVGLEGGYRLGLSEYINNVSGVYYLEEDVTLSDPFALDPQYIGNITFAKEQAPLSQLVSESGKRNYLFVLLTLSYRFKS
jgi:hypothetical protein